MKNPNLKLAFFYSVMVGSFFVLMINVLGKDKTALAYIMIVFSVSLFLLAVTKASMISFSKKPCGHGMLAQNRFGFFHPFVAHKCHVCGKQNYGHVLNEE